MAPRRAADAHRLQRDTRGAGRHHRQLSAHRGPRRSRLANAADGHLLAGRSRAGVGGTDLLTRQEDRRDPLTRCVGPRTEHRTDSPGGAVRVMMHGTVTKCLLMGTIPCGSWHVLMWDITKT